jgi:hypothetical protein
VRRLAGAGLLAISVLLASCGAQQQGTPAAQMSSWVKGTSFGQTVRTVQTDAARAREVLASGTTAEIHTACGVYLVDVEQANGLLPTSDTQASNLLASAYGSLGLAAHDCYDAPGSLTKRASFAAAQAKGLAELSEGVARVEAVLGMSLAQVGGATEGVTGASGDSGDGL